MRILYPVPEILPDARARFLQIVNTCHALAREGHRVVLAAGASPGWTAERMFGFYDLPAHENLSFARRRRMSNTYPRIPMTAMVASSSS